MCLRACAKCKFIQHMRKVSSKHFVVSNDSVCGQQRPWSDCADAQSDLGLSCPPYADSSICPKTRFRTAQPKWYPTSEKGFNAMYERNKQKPTSVIWSEPLLSAYRIVGFCRNREAFNQTKQPCRLIYAPTVCIWYKSPFLHCASNKIKSGICHRERLQNAICKQKRQWAVFIATHSGQGLYFCQGQYTLWSRSLHTGQVLYI